MRVVLTFTTFVAVLAVLLGTFSVSHALFMDMYGKVFQVELLGDCTVYVYDRVMETSGPPGWCKSPKAYMNPSAFIHNGKIIAAVYSTYIDKNNIVHLGVSTSDSTEKYDFPLISQDYFEMNDKTLQKENFTHVKKTTKVGHTATTGGKYVVGNFYNDENKLLNFTILYCSPRYNQTSRIKLNRFVSYNADKDEARIGDVGDDEKCLPKFLQNRVTYGVLVRVEVDQKRPDVKLCSVSDLKYELRSISMSIQTAVLGYSMFANFSASFSVPYCKEIAPLSDNYAGISIAGNTLTSTEGTTVTRAPLEKHYAEVPFFLMNNDSSYSALFLYYKFEDSDRDFTVRFIYKQKYYYVFKKPIKYMDECNFKDNNISVAAAPKVTSQNDKIINFQVYFLLNDNQFKYCVLDVSFDYTTQENTYKVNRTSDINGYVHVKTRSTSAVNCDYGNRTVRWLLAYTENEEAELVSLDDDSSSPIFPCKSCNASTLMYCDINPSNFDKYDSAVYLAHGNSVQYVGVKRNGYIKTIEHYTSEPGDSPWYFGEQLSFTLDLDVVYTALQKGQLNISPDASVDPASGGDGGDGGDGDGDGGGGSGGDDGGDDSSNANAHHYAWMVSFFSLIIAYVFYN